MATIESWTGTIADIGPIYPMGGSETVLVIIGLAAWIAWHVLQAKRENREYEEQQQRFGDPDSLKRLLRSEDPRRP